MKSEIPDWINTPELKKAQKKIERAKASLAKAKVDRDSIIANSKWECGSCGAENAIKETPYEDLYYYIAPHGCTGGDYHALDKHDAHFHCPKCNATFRAYFNKWALELRDYFRNITKEKEAEARRREYDIY